MRNKPDDGAISGACWSHWKMRSGISLLQVLGVLGVLGLLACLFFPAPRRAREAARRTQCKNNLKQIGLALYNYHETFDSYPPAYTVDANGRPLHSWRTLILPFIDQAPMYNQIDFSKPWNDPANAKAYETHLAAYQCPSSATPVNHTVYLAIAAPGGCFGSSEPCKLRDITDGSSQTLMVIEGALDQAVHWMSPIDADESFIMGFGEKTKFQHVGGTHALLADGTVRFLSMKLDSKVRRALVSIDAGDKVGEF